MMGGNFTLGREYFSNFMGAFFMVCWGHSLTKSPLAKPMAPLKSFRSIGHSFEHTIIDVLIFQHFFVRI